jgi:hypothetical protein
MRGKEFYTRDGVKIATRDPKAIAGWTWPENVGLACGEPSGVDVLDVDDPQGCPLDVEGLVATTLAATTPGGGYHLFYRHAGLRSRNFQWGEWRSTGLAVVLPPGPGRGWVNRREPQRVPANVLEVVERPRAIGDGHSSSLSPLVTPNDQLPKPIYLALLQAMPLPSVERRHQRWAGSILRRLIAASSGRNAALVQAILEFRSVPIAPSGARALLVMACDANGYLKKVGPAHVHGVISAMLQPPEGRGEENAEH